MLPVSGNPIYYVEDLLGTSRVITTNTGVVCYDADFYPFGGERPPYTNNCPATNNYKFEGKERDTETGNDDFGARYYSNRFGRWLSADWSNVPVPVPYANLTNPQTLNLYSMVADDPESFADLDGHECTPMPPVVNTCASNNNTPPTIGEGATQAAQPMSTADKAKLALDVVGFVPVVGDFANAASAVISLAQGHLGEAALSAVAAIPLVGAVGEAGKAVKLTEEAAKLGKAGEEAAQIVKNTEHIESITKTAAYRVPDMLNHAAKTIGEVKNTAKLYLTKQMKDTIAYAAKKGYNMELITRAGTKISKPLGQALDSIKAFMNPKL